MMVSRKAARKWIAALVGLLAATALALDASAGTSAPTAAKADTIVLGTKDFTEE